MSPEKQAVNWWLTQRRLLRHAAGCSYVALDGVITDDGMEWARHNLGNLYEDQGKLAGHEKALSPKHGSTLHIVNNLGILYSKQGKLAEAEAMYQQALAGQEKALPPEHMSTLNTVNNVGNLYRDPAEVEAICQQALAGKEKMLGPEHMSTLNTVGNLGILYRDQGKLAEPETMYQSSIRDPEK